MLACGLCGGVFELFIGAIVCFLSGWGYWKCLAWRHARKICSCGGTIKLVLGVMTLGIFGACWRCIKKLCRCKSKHEECHCHDRKSI